MAADRNERIQKRAAELAGAFVTLDRANTDGAPRLVKLADGSPKWMRDACYAAHGKGDMLPDDWRYWMIEAVAEALGEGADPDDAGETADGLVPIYTHDRLQWLATKLDRAGYVDEAIAELGDGTLPDGGITEAIGWGIYAEISEVFSLLVGALENLDDENNEDDEDEAGA